MMTNRTEKPLISVCIPAYNNADYISDTIQCILDQTLTDLELIICDDHSKDNTVDVIKSFDDPRIRLLINEKNLVIPFQIWKYFGKKISFLYFKFQNRKCYKSFDIYLNEKYILWFNQPYKTKIFL